MAWKQLLPGAIEPEAGTFCRFQNYLGQMVAEGTFDRMVLPEQADAKLMRVYLRELRDPVPMEFPVWFEEVM